MWLFCKSGFFSAVQHAENPSLIHVRARFEGDIERLCEVNGIRDVAVEHTPGNDYPYRADFPRSVWAEVVSREASVIDYTNFKNAVHDSTSRDQAYMAVWASLRRLSEDRFGVG